LEDPGIDIRNTRLDVVEWIHLAQNGNQWQVLVNMVRNRWLP